MSNNKMFDNCLLIYNKMMEHGERRNGLWLEANDISIDYLESYQDEVYVYTGAIKDISDVTEFGRTTVTNCLYTMRACGWITSYVRGMYILIKHPNDLDYHEFKIRTSSYFTDYEARYASPKEWVAAEVNKVHNRLDELERIVKELDAIVRRG